MDSTAARGPGHPLTARPGPGAATPPDSTAPARRVRNLSVRRPAPARAPRVPVPRAAALDEVVFTVVDLETTGLAPESERMTEIGAVRVRGFEVLAEFATLVAPGVPVPPTITELTGISDATLAGAPPPHEVLPEFLRFARGDVLVAHNAPFDLAFLQAACAAAGLRWPRFEVVDTLSLARTLLPRDRVPDFRLPTLARHLNAPLPPTHRAVDDARATAHVLRQLIGLAHRAGVHDLPGLHALCHQDNR